MRISVAVRRPRSCRQVPDDTLAILVLPRFPRLCGRSPSPREHIRPGYRLRQEPPPFRRNLDCPYVAAWRATVGRRQAPEPPASRPLRGGGDRLRVLRHLPLGRPQRQAQDDAVVPGVAGSRGGSGASSPGYFLDGRAVAEGEVHGVDGVKERGGKISGLTGVPRNPRLTWRGVAARDVSGRQSNGRYGFIRKVDSCSANFGE